VHTAYIEEVKRSLGLTMYDAPNAKEFAAGIDIGIYTTNFENEFISLTDIAKYRNEDDTRLKVR